ncbi:Btbd1 [Symbiodinium natans]|uniref:Btbd1 protein n=1 Tax=Symbiodinium natans TaxID=878477 RepID=A0A812NX10_9DINO|nr:Btbd1 [Symbiodinium natans]CAE7496063.1 Btbd1 [Symbiodinium natans]
MRLEACGSFIEENTNPGNVTQVLRLFDMSCRLGLDRYSKHFLELLGGLSRVHTRQVLQARDFLHLHTVSLATLLSFDGLCVNEERLWKALRAWAELRAMYREGSSERIGNYGEVPVERYWGLPGYPYNHLMIHNAAALLDTPQTGDERQAGAVAHSELVADIYGEGSQYTSCGSGTVRFCAVRGSSRFFVT